MRIPEQFIGYLVPMNEELFELGIKIGKIYTDFGLPIDMALEKIKGDKKAKAQILYGAQNWLIEHRRNSSATDKALDRQRKINIQTMEAFIKTGESGIY